MSELLSDQDASPEAKALFEEIKKDLGMVPNFFRAMAAKDPQWAQLNWQRHKLIMGNQGALDRSTKEMMAMVVAYMSHCHYCSSAHEMMAGMTGASPEQIIEAKQVMELFTSFSNIANSLNVPLDSQF